MNYLPGTDGPQIAQGDIVNFKFKHCELSLRLPKIPYDLDIIDSVCNQSDWSEEDPKSWEDVEIGFNRELIHQSWKYRHLENREYVAMCYLRIGVLTLNNISDQTPETLNSARFKRYSFELINAGFDTSGTFLEDSPRPENEFFLEIIETPTSRGIRFLSVDNDVQLHHPKIIAVLILDRKMLLRIEFEVFPYNYTDSINPFNDKQIRKFKMDLFDELMAHLVIKFDPELQAEIAQQNS